MNNNFSFQKGWYQIPQGKVADVRKKISAKLGITTRMAFMNRLNGETFGTIAEREAIERIFAEYNITDVWGNV